MVVAACGQVERGEHYTKRYIVGFKSPRNCTAGYAEDHRYKLVDSVFILAALKLKALKP